MPQTSIKLEGPCHISYIERSHKVVSGSLQTKIKTNLSFNYLLSRQFKWSKQIITQKGT